MDRKKQLREQYKERKVIGGICRIVNRENGKYYLQYTDDIQGNKNAFSFFSSDNPAIRAAQSCPYPPIRRDWEKYGADAFELEILEEMEKKMEQSREEFTADLKVLYELWQEQLDPEKSYTHSQKVGK